MQGDSQLVGLARREFSCVQFLHFPKFRSRLTFESSPKFLFGYLVCSAKVTSQMLLVSLEHRGFFL